jgi:hypothetical protein
MFLSEEICLVCGEAPTLAPNWQPPEDGCGPETSGFDGA